MSMFDKTKPVFKPKKIIF